MSNAFKLPPFSCTAKIDGDTLIISISGYLDQNADFSAIKLGNAKKVAFDLTELALMNSSGIRAWVSSMRDLTLSPTTPKFHFSNCPKIFVDHLNMVMGLVPTGAVIDSFHVPYFCANCDECSTRLYRRDVDYTFGTAEKAPTWQIHVVKCAKCNDALEMDVAPQAYFAFLRYKAI